MKDVDPRVFTRMLRKDGRREGRTKGRKEGRKGMTDGRTDGSITISLRNFVGEGIPSLRIKKTGLKMRTSE